MNHTRTAQGYPWAVASLCGFVVAVVSGVTGVLAHWVATTDPMPVTADAVLGTVAACAGAGILTSAGVGSFPPTLIVPAGLVAAQGCVHYALEWSHRLHADGHGPGHGADALSGHAAHALSTPAEQAAMARDAMIAGAEVAGHGAPGWPMLASHAVATLVAAGALAVVTSVLGWLVARVEQLTISHLWAADRARSMPTARVPHAPTTRFLLTRGLLRGPPALLSHNVMRPA